MAVCDSKYYPLCSIRTGGVWLMEQSKRFDEWIPVDCNKCARYWDSSCDGVKCDVNSNKPLQGSTRLCNSFLPTRSVVIPEQIKSLQKSVKWLAISIALIGASCLIHVLTHIFGGY